MPKLLRLLILGLLLMGIAFIAFLWFIDTNTPQQNRYLIPEGYNGWLCTSYGVPTARPLKIEDGFRIVQFDSKGVVETSDEGMPGKHKDEFLFYSERGTRPLSFESEMGGGFTTADQRSPNHYTFFFWVSKNAKAEQPSYSPGNPTPKCGHK